MTPRALNIDEPPFVLVRKRPRASCLACDHCPAIAQERRHPGDLTTEDGATLLDETTRFGDDQLVVVSGAIP
jgi:MoaA/NifB/PqqE/SkfB family radical SAM enzyme